MPRPDWKKRAARARELISEASGAAELLRFYAPVLDFQGRMYDVVAARAAVPDLQRSLRAQLDPDLLAAFFPELLATVEKHGTAQLRATAAELRRQGEPRWRELLLDHIGGQSPDPDAGDFFARACVEPYAEHLASQIAAQSPQTTSSCPACAGKPMLAILRPEGEGARRSLVCSFCLNEWDFRRLLCPACGQDNELNLPVYTSEGLPYIRVESCDSCHHYLLAVDLSKNGLVIPLVDQIAAAPLDLWAAEKGYAKIAPHLLGL